MLRKTLLIVLAMMISIAVNSSAQIWSEMGEITGSPLGDVPLAERLDVAVEPIDVLFVVADVPDAYKAIYDKFNALPESGVCDRFNSNTGTPPVDQLKKYDVVIVWANTPHASPDALGNNLADYIDAGGNVIASAPSRIPPSWFIGGRFRSGGYDPFISETGPLPPATLGMKNPHPIMEKPYLITNLWGDFRTKATMDPGAELVAKWSDNNPLVATKGSVVGLTAFLHGSSIGKYWNGQFPELLANACVWLVGGVPVTGTIDGKVKDAVTGKPVPEATVIAINADSKEKARVATDANGYYKIPDLEPGAYYVLCIKKGYKAGIKKAEVVAGSVTTVDFSLSPKTE